jgi:hypothetical protein
VKILTFIDGKKLRVIYVLLVPFLPWVIFFSPLLVTTGWTLRHGGHVVYEGRTIPLPFGWREYRGVWENKNGIAIAKAPVTVVGLFRQEGRFFERNNIMLIAKFAAPTPVKNPNGTTGMQYENQTYWISQRELSMTGPEIRQSIVVNKRGWNFNHSSCLRSVDSKNSMVEFHCELDDMSWEASYLGDPAEADRFIKVLLQN